VYAQVLYPNAIGIGGQTLANEVKDPALRRLCVEIYNDAMAEGRTGRATGSCRCPCCPRGASRSACARPSASPRWASGA
jgi:hypothetical protein